MSDKVAYSVVLTQRLILDSSFHMTMYIYNNLLHILFTLNYFLLL